MLDQRVGRHLLEHLVVLIEHAARGVDHADMVVAVAVAGGAAATLEAHEQDVDVGVVLPGILSSRKRTQQLVPTRGHPLRNHRRQRADDRVGIGRAQMVAECGRRRIRGIEQRALGNDDVDGRDHAVVMRDVGVHHLQKGQDRGRGAGRVGAVDEAVGLRVGLRVVEPDVIAVDGDLDPDHVLRPRVLSVEVDVGLALVDAVGDGADLRLHHPRRGIEQRLLVRFEALEPVLGDQRQEPPLADGAAADLGAHVLLHHVEADVSEDQIPERPCAACRAR